VSSTGDRLRFMKQEGWRGEFTRRSCCKYARAPAIRERSGGSQGHLLINTDMFTCKRLAKRELGTPFAAFTHLINPCSNPVYQLHRCITAHGLDFLVLHRHSRCAARFVAIHIPRR